MESISVLDIFKKGIGTAVLILPGRGKLPFNFSGDLSI